MSSQTTCAHRELGKIKRALLARRAALRQRHERIQQDLQRRNDPLAADAPDRAVQLQLHAVTCAACTRD